MKTVTKTFYVSDYAIGALKKESYFPTTVTMNEPNKVKITWEEEEKKVKITESEFDEMINRHVTSNTSDFAILLKREIFKEQR